MSKIEEIRQLLNELIKRKASSPTILMNVKSVDADNKTCVLVNDEELEFPDVRLRPVVDENEGLTIFPKLGTWCLAVRIEDDEQFTAIAFGEVEKYRLKIDKTLFEITKAGVKIEKNGDSLKDVLDSIVDATMQIVVVIGNNPNYEKLTQAKAKIQNLLK